MIEFYIELITPEKTFFRGNVEMLIVNSTDGEMGILANHAPTVAAIVPGAVKIKVSGEWKEAFSSGGFIEIRPDETILLSQALEWPEEIEAARARAAIERAESRLKHAKSRKEYMLGKASMARALARLRVKSHYTSEK